MSKKILPIVGVLIFLMIWEVGAILTGSLLLPRPSHIPAVFVRELSSGLLLSTAAASLRHYSIGVLVGAAAGMSFGIVSALLPVVRLLTSWVIRLLRPIPPLAWIPFAIIWFGINELSAAFIISVGVFWVNFFATFTAVKGVDYDLIEVAIVFEHSSFMRKLFQVIIPAAAPGIVGGIRASLGMGWMTVIAAELFGIAGIGQRMREASGLLATTELAVYMITISLLYGIIDFLFTKLVYERFAYGKSRHA